MVNVLKTIGKIIVILLVAALVAAGIYLAVQNGSTNTNASFSEQNFNSQQFQNSGSTSQPQFRPERGGDFGDGHGNNANLTEGLAGMLGTLLKIATVGALVLFVQNLIVNVKRKQKTVRVA